QTASDLLRSSGQAPFPILHLKLMNYGSGSTVFLLSGKNGYNVLKVYRRSLGKHLHTLQELAEAFRQKYQMIASWYADQPNLVLPANFLILHGPIFDSPAVACLQPYISGA